MLRQHRPGLPLLLLMLPVLICACSSSDDGPTTPPPPTDAAVLAAGWAAFTAGDLPAAGAEFRELISRGALKADAHDGLGWTSARLSQADSSHFHFELSLDNGAADLPIADEVFAGLAFALDALNLHEDCLLAAAQVSSDWVFTHDPDLDHDDVVLLTAIAHYALGDFEASLLAVQILDPDFDADVETVAGRAQLAARIEELQG